MPKNLLFSREILGQVRFTVFGSVLKDVGISQENMVVCILKYCRLVCILEMMH